MLNSSLLLAQVLMNETHLPLLALPRDIILSEVISKHLCDFDVAIFRGASKTLYTLCKSSTRKNSTGKYENSITKLRQYILFNLLQKITKW